MSGALHAVPYNVLRWGYAPILRVCVLRSRGWRRLETGFLLGLAEVIAVEPETRFLCALVDRQKEPDREE
jgi:hypothetical protein